jgi:hypothetical protein
MILRMANSAGARILMVLGFVAASLAYNAWIASRTVLDTGATADVVHHIVTTPSLQHSLRDALRKALEQRLDYVPSNPAIQRAIENAARDPRISAAFEDAIVQLHRALLSHGAATITLDPSVMTRSMYDQLVVYDPTLATEVENSPPLQVQFDTHKLPRLDALADKVHTARTLGLAAGVLLIAASLMLVRDKKAVSRVGRRIAYLAIIPLLAFAVLPWVLDSLGGAGAQVGAVVLRSYSGRVLPSAIALILIGVSTALIAWVGMPRTSQPEIKQAPKPAPPPVDTRLPEKLYL